jgi:diguanylate cyclase (GGDEF)-like protein
VSISRHASVLEALLDAVCLVNPLTLRIAWANSACLALLGLAREELMNKPVVELTATPEDMYFWEDVAAGFAQDLHSDSLVRSADGISLPVERKVSRIMLDGIDGSMFLVSLRDLRNQKQVEEELESRLAEMRATLESTGDAILVLDQEGKVRNFNRRFTELWNVPAALQDNPDEAKLLALMAQATQDAAVYAAGLQAILQSPDDASNDIVLLRSGRILERVSQPLFSRSRPRGRVFSFRDLTERLEAQKRIETLAYTDALTGLPNRLMLTQRVNAALKTLRRTGGTFAVLFIDLDRFKNINESLGQVLGNRVLIEAADRILQSLREVDILSRVGGDEFVAYLHEADPHGAEIVARRILTLLADAFSIDDVKFTLGCSIGVAMYPDDGLEMDELIQCADTAMVSVKERGRGNFRFYQPQMNVDLLSRMKMDHAMRQALLQADFQLHYQPQISLCHGGLLGAEALIRWHDPVMGAVSPGSFIPLAEESGFIIQLGQWVLEEAVRQAAHWEQAGLAVVVSVNVSALQFQQAGFVEKVARVLRESNLSPALLELELTESILVREADEAMARLHALKALGIMLAIDDFGTGYSSLAYLKIFPIAKLKIDRVFVSGLPADEGDCAIVGATIAMAQALKMTVVAEGVETQAQRDFLQSLHCTAFQGFLCSPALPADKFEILAASLTTVQA